MTPSQELAREITKFSLDEWRIQDEYEQAIEPLIRSAFEKFRERAAKICLDIRDNNDQEVINHIHDAEEPEACAYSIRNMEV